MAKQTADHLTVDLFGHGPGRPKKQNALTGAQRAARFRAKRKLFPVTRNENSAVCEWCACERSGVCRICGEGA
ncbi:hypothetical protein [Burkholderia cepacia]|uniref:hypothetical protein n=1 Tax=Burkholderia cepacia TaxID=292 RepID=UPI000B18E526|nr:hypothetical protein [Burkholderia cepacia]